MKPETVSQRIEEGLGVADVVLDGADCSFVVTVISPTFAGKRPLQRQREVLNLFSEELSSGALHALTIIAKTPDES